LPQPLTDQFVEALAAVFREAREKSGMSQKRLAETSGVGRTGIVTLEAGQRIPSILICKMLADGMGVQLNSLLAEVEKKVPRVVRKSQ
jgi:DNA-binding XRE family transcriptional regulator